MQIVFPWHKYLLASRFFGKRNLHVRHAPCPDCGVHHQLLSFDARRYLVFLGLPWFPLARYRVTDHCPSCGRFEDMRLHHWIAAAERVVRQALDACQQDPANVETAHKAIDTAWQYPHPETSLELAAQLEATLGDNAELLARLGNLYLALSHPEAAERVWHAALALEFRWDLYESLAVLLIADSRPDEAGPYLQHVLAERWVDKVPILFLAVECYQAWSMHHDALQILDQCAQAFPRLQDKHEYRAYRSVSEKHRRDGKKIKPAHFGAVS